MKKLLSAMLVLTLILSCIYSGVWALDTSDPAGTNLMKDYTYKDWKVTSRATINAPTESFSGDTSNAFSVTKLMWRSAYTKINLEAGETYELSFYYKEDDSSKVYLTDSGNRGVLMAPTGTLTFTDEITLTNNDYSNNLLNDLNYNIPSDKEGWYVVSAVISPSVTGEHTFSFTGAAPDVNDLSLIHFSDFSLVKQGEDPNVFANTKASDWFSGWNGNTGEAVAGGAIAIKTAWRSGYTKVTLKPNTKYNLSFNASTVKVTDARVFPADEITNNAQLTCPSGGGKLPGGTTNLANGVFTSTAPSADFATSSADVVNTYYNVSESFTTTDATEYYVVIDCSQFLNNPTVNPYCTFVQLKDLSLVADGAEEEKPEEDIPGVIDPNKAIADPDNWNSTWRLQGASVSITATADSKDGGAGIKVDKSNWRDTFVKLTLKANAKYDFAFNYKGASKLYMVKVIAVNDIDSAKWGASTERVEMALKTGAKPIFAETVPCIYDNATWNEISVSFETNENTEYYIVLYTNDGSGFVASDFNFVSEGGESETPVTDPNVLNDEVMKSLTWKALWGTVTNNPKGTDLNKSESFSGNSYAMTFVRSARYRDNYTVVALKPNTTYNFSFRYKSATDEYISGLGFVDASKVDFSTIKGDRVKNHLTDASTEVLGAAEASIGREVGGPWNLGTTTFKTGDATEYVMFFAVEEVVADQGFTTITLSDFSLVEGEEQQPDPNVLNDNTMKSLTWSALWGTVVNNPKTADLDKSQSFSGNSYAMTFGRNSRYRDNYTVVTLKPNTTYDFSFRYKAAGVEEIVHYVGFVPASKTDFSTIKGDHVEKHLTDASVKILGKDNATVEKQTNGVWNLASTTFKTGDDTEYVMYMGIGSYADNSFNTITFSDFSLVEGEEQLPDPNALNDEVMKSLSWNALWGSSVRNPKEADLDKSQSFSGNSYAMTFGRTSRYRDNYTIITLQPNTIYKFSFRYKSGDTDEFISALGFVDASKADFSTIKGDRVSNHLTDSSVEILGAANATIEKEVGGVWNLASTVFKTGDATKYVMYLAVDEIKYDDSFKTITLSDFNMVEGTEDDLGGGQQTDPDNVLADSKPNDWTSSWNFRKGVTAGNAISLAVAYRSGYTKVTLVPNVTYHFNFDFENVKVKDIRVYPASEITDPNTQLLSGENGGDAVGGKTNLATDALTSDCSIPAAGATYSAFEAFTTNDETEYYIFLDCGAFTGNTSIFLKNLSLKLYYNPATDVYGTLRTGSMGGSVENKGTQPYTKGEETTVVAVPLEGNSFLGWFDAAGNKVSGDKKYTFTVKSEFDLSAKFSGPNMPYIDWMKENGMDGTFENGNMPGWYAVDEGTGVVAYFAVFEPSTDAYHNGKKSMTIRARYQHSYYHFNNLAKESDYYLSFYIYCPDDTPYDSSQEIGKQGFKMNQMYVKVGDDTIWSKSNQFGDGNKSWHKLEFFFNTGNADSATLCLNYYGDANIASKGVYIDDVNFIQYAADGLDNGDFEDGKAHWMGEFTSENGDSGKAAGLAKGKKLYQTVKTNPHTAYTVAFRAKGELTAAATQMHKYSVLPADLVSSVTTLTTSGDWAEYTFDVYTGMNSAINLVFEALADGVMVDDITITEKEDSTGAILEKIDFETDRFLIKNSNTNTDVFGIYEGTEFAHSGNKSLHFKYSAADSKTEYKFQESYLGFQISNTRVYRLTFYYKTAKGSAIKISPDYLGTQAGSVGVTHTAAGDGWYRVEFFASSSSAIYFDPIISNILGKTKADFYVDDITYTLVSAAVLESNIDKLYAEPPIALLYNEGFENPITDKDWGKLPSTMQVVKGDTQFGNKFLKVKGKTFYVLPVSVESGAQYYITASLRGKGGYLGLSTSADGKGLFEGVSGEVESFITVNSNKWVRDGFKFSAPMSGVIYLVISQESGSMDVDNVLIYKENYALAEVPYGHDVLEPYNYEATSGKNYILNGGYDADGNVLDDESPATGDTFPAVAIVLVTFAAAVTMLLSGRKNKKEAEL